MSNMRSVRVYIDPVGGDVVKFMRGVGVCALAAVLAITHSLVQAEELAPKSLDSGALTCASDGQEKKIEQWYDAGSNRVFSAFEITETAKTGVGDCTIAAVENKTFKVKAVENFFVEVEKPVKYLVRVRAACGGADVGKTARTQCAVTGATEEMK